MRIGWLEQVQADVPANDDWLGPAEQMRLAGLRITKRRADWRLGRWTAKLAIAAWLDYSTGPLTLASIEIIPAESGAPEVFVAAVPSAVSISISHSGGRALCSVGAPELVVGCDLEQIEPRSAAFVSDYFTADEQQAISRCADGGRERFIALLWSAKESTLKTLRTGLRLDTRNVSVEVPDRTAPPGDVFWGKLCVRHEGREFAGWWRADGNLVRTCVSEPSSTQPEPLILPLEP